VVAECGKTVIAPSVVNTSLDFLSSEDEYRRVWQAFTAWLRSAVSSQLRADVPRFCSIGYRLFNLGICIPTLHIDPWFLRRYNLTQERTLSSRIDLTPNRSQQVRFSQEILGKMSSLPPARASFALDSILCVLGKMAGEGKALLVDCRVGVLAARSRAVKFTFVQGADSLEIVHRSKTTTLRTTILGQPEHGYSQWRGVVRTRGRGNTTAGNQGNGHGGPKGCKAIHAFGKCYIPYTSRGNKELAAARAREAESLVNSWLHEKHPEGVEGEEDMTNQDSVEVNE
ncbi:unnamed protein product, partial [Discosporangium mesarthrocarpum]